MTHTAENDAATPLLNFLRNACRCGDCYHPLIGPDTDGDPCDWCRDCGCPSADHHRMAYVIPPAKGQP